ncbi:unnamed protein product [Rotaria socialis]|uniref:Selenocysteine-specific elongation factor C-terminal RIFT domain-containing protein n=1 Tax=Rotaria socialis TaxID=392032 RepID=A0A820TL60_9BILA|nr:unnamed protein product [Rotaria socialis]CAF3323645.1 unnamed protein product [Rotaria socialis]CAF3324171.1 unnamed protein product [Rotaria socialis]CAF3628215.1 unnamed protein product [Rotaria socialis]CAF4097143.1 unnamed protein product [Rotaria socialis]
MQPMQHLKPDFLLAQSPRPTNGKENNEPSTPLSVKRKQVFINEKNTSILQLWDQKLRLSNDRMEAYALSEMANIERLRTVEQQITSTVDEITNEFKQRIQSVLSNNQLLLTQVPHTLAPSTLFKDGQHMSSEAFFDEMNKRYFTNDKSFEKYAETMELFRSTFLTLKKNNDQLRAQMKNVNINQTLLEMQERLEDALLERDSYVSLYTMAKIRAEKAEEKNNKSNEQQQSIVELLVEKFGFADRVLDSNTVLARDLFKPDTNIEIFINFNVQLSTGEQGYIETAKGCPPGKFKICIPNGILPETKELISKNDDESIEPVRVILKFRKYLFQSDANLDQIN